MSDDKAMTDADDRQLTQLYERLLDVSDKSRVRVDDVISAIGRHSMIPFLLVPAFLAATPLSGIPGLSSVCGLTIAFVSLRLLLNYDQMILPNWIERKAVDGKKLRSALEKSAPVVHWIDRHTRRRWRGLFHRPIIWVPQALCLFSGLTMPFLEFIPFTASIAATGVCFLALSLLMKDGLLFLIALLPYGALIYLLVTQFLLV